MKQHKRLIYALAGVIVMLFAGFVYAWSILSAPIAADFPNWDSAQLSLAFTLCMAFFCLGGLAAGILSKRLSVRFQVLFSAVLFLTGFFLTSRASSLPILYVGYGVLCGSASGFAYNSVMNVMPQWFPDRQGLISGVLLMGFGASSMVIGSAFTALTPDQPGAWRTSLLIMGVLMAAVLSLGSFFFQIPPKDALSTSKPQHKAAVEGLDLPPGKMLRRASFWFFFIWVTLLSAVGLVIIGQARALAAVAAPSFDAAALSFAVGLISVCNGLGRVLFGGLFDVIGARKTMLLVALSLLLGTALLAGAQAGAPLLLLLAFGFIGLGYGGGPTMAAAFVKASYGPTYYPVNFPLMNLNLLVASFASTAAGALYDASGSYTIIFVLLFVLIVGALIVMPALRKL